MEKAPNTASTQGTSKAKGKWPSSVDELCEVLQRCGLLAEDQVKDIFVRKGAQRGRVAMSKKNSGMGFRRGEDAIASVTSAEIVASFGFNSPSGRPLTEDRIMQALSDETGIPYVKIDPLKLDMELVTKTITRPFAMKHTMLPIGIDGSVMTVAIDDPKDIEGIDMIRRITGYDIRLVLSARADIDKIIREFYGFRTSLRAAAAEISSDFDIGNLEQYVRMKSEGTFDPSDQPIVNAVEHLLRYAYDQRASDIHIEPKRDHCLVRFRIDGVLHKVQRIPKVLHPAIISRIKVLSRMDIAEKRRPQDGRIKTEHEGKEIELRVSTLPIAFGEKIVLRIFDPDILLQDLEQLGFFPREYKLFSSFISQPHGIILVTGPTGGGKTTTLYSALKTISSPEVNITTIEDPIEMLYDEFNQVGVQPKADITFANSLRTILRQDPDIIMVGEIRDLETAKNAIQAALTGHLVLSTLHTNDTATAITRLIELGVESFLISGTLLGIVAQRLVRKICPHCIKETFLTQDEMEAIGIQHEDGKQLKVHYGEGCISCRSTGYLGRTALMEVMPVTDRLKKLINAKKDSTEIKKLAVEDGMLTLREAALKKLGMGVTTLSEVLRVTSEK